MFGLRANAAALPVKSAIKGLRFELQRAAIVKR